MTLIIFAAAADAFDYASRCLFFLDYFRHTLPLLLIFL